MSDTFRPSTTYKGSEAPELFELKPRIRIEARNDGRKYVFLRTADLAATYRAYKGLPVE